MTEYPILVGRFSGDQAVTIICERCSAEAVIGPDDLLNEGIYECPSDTEIARRGLAWKRCRGHAVMKYDEGDRCKGCGKLGYWHGSHPSPIDGCCSRVCKLQADYAESLKARREVAS